MFGNKKRANRPEETEEVWSDVTEYEYEGAYEEQGSWAADDEDEYEEEPAEKPVKNALPQRLLPETI